MRSWHPLSKLTIVLGLGALALVWWFDHGAPGDTRTAAALSSALGPAPPATPAATPESLPNQTVGADHHVETRPLPPVDTFASMIDRPLFAPARRPIEPAVDITEFEVLHRTLEPAAAPAYPSVSFVGSIEENGRVRALLGDGSVVRGVAVGEEVEGWTVLAIEARRLTLGHRDEILELAIFE